MSNSLDNFVHDALQEHDAAPSGDGVTVITGGPRQVASLGALPGHAVEGFIARGGMGAVYRAKQTALEREVAVKVMTALEDSPEMAERFRREALVLGRLEHPNIVPVHDIGTDDDGQLFYTMKLVKGRTLQHILNDLRDKEPETTKAHSLAALLTIFRKVCDALAFAHSQGVLHRDLKPENVMVGEFGEVLVMDWGLAKEMGNVEREARNGGRDPAAADSAIRNPQSAFATLQGAVMGTPQYMSPEQARGEIDALDVRSDIFSLGGILYAILTLRPPVEGTTLDEVLEKVRTGSITPPTAYGASTATKGAKAAKGAVLEARRITPLPHIAGGKVSQALSAVVMKALQLETAQRYQTVAALSTDIEAYQGGFATSAENAGAIKQIKLLMLRHKAVTASLAAMLLISIGFVIKVMASEQKATRNAEIATANEKRASASAEESRRSLARAQIALADAAATNLDFGGLRAQLDLCPEDLRDDVWRYLDAKARSAIARVDALKDGAIDCIFRHTEENEAGGEFILADKNRSLIHVVRPDTGQVIRSIECRFSGRKHLAATADRSQIAVFASDQVAYQVIDYVTGRELSWYSEPEKGRLDRAGMTPDGKRVFIVFRNATRILTQMRERDSGAIVWSRAAVGNTGTLSADGRHIAMVTYGDPQVVTVLSAETGQLISRMEPGHTFIWSMRFNANSSLLAAADYSGFLMLWDVATGRKKQSFRVCSGRLTGVDFTADDKLVTLGQATANTTSPLQIQVWNAQRVAQLDAILGIPPNRDGVGRMTIDPVGGWICTFGDQVGIYHSPFSRHSISLKKVNQSRTLAFLGRDYLMDFIRSETVGIWDLSTSPPKELPPLAARFDSVTTNASKTLAVLGSSSQPSCFIARLPEQGPPLLEKSVSEVVSGLPGISSGGEHLVLCTSRGLHLFSLATSALVRQLNASEPPLAWSSAIFVDGDRKIAAAGMKKVVTGQQQSVLAAWDRESGALLHEQELPFLNLALVASPDGRQFALGGMDKSVSIFSGEDFRLIRRFRAHDKAVTGIAWHPTRPILATVSDDISLKLWNPATGDQIGRAIGKERSFLSVAFNSTGERIAVGGEAEATLVFDLPDVLSITSLKPAIEVDIRAKSTAAEESGSVTSVDKPHAKPAIKAGADGWFDLLGAANAADIAKNGNGWKLQDGALHSPEGTKPVTVALSHAKLSENFTLRVTVRQAAPTERFIVIFPVAEQHIGINFDMWAPGYGSVLAFKNSDNTKRPDVVWGRKFADLKQHTIEVSVRVTQPQARIEVRLDCHPHYQWNGLLTDVALADYWHTAKPGAISVGAAAPHWIVSEVKVKALEK